MVSRPVQGGNSDTWGTDLNAWLDQEFTALATKYSSKTLIAAPWLTVDGHSIPHGSGTGVTPGTNDMSTLTASSVGIRLVNRSIAGAVLYNHLSAEDWGDIMQAETRSTKFSPVGGLRMLMYGINDGAYLGNTATALRPYKEALRAVVARMRCTTVFEDNDASISYAGTWSVTSTTAGNSGSGVHFSAVNSSTFTLTLPTTNPGGTLDIGLIAWNDGSYGTVTGPSSLGTPVYDLSVIAGTDCRRTGVMRITSLPSGAGTYTFTISSVSGATGVILDWIGVEPDEAACPVIALIGQCKPLDYTAQIGSPAGPMTDAGVDALNTIQQAVATEFGARVLYVDTSAIDKSASYFVSGNIHPNAAGHAYIAAQASAAIKAVGQYVEIDLSTTTSSTTGWQSYTPTVTGVTIGNGTISAAYRSDSDNNTEFYCRVTFGSTTSLTGTVTVTLPVSVMNAYSKVDWNVILLNSGVSYKTATALLLTLSALTIRAGGYTDNGDGTATLTDDLTNLSSNWPFVTWNTSDYFEVSGRYRTA